MKFIYTFDEEARDFLIAKGYPLLKESLDNGIAIFENKDEFNYGAPLDCRCVFSNVLTF